MKAEQLGFVLPLFKLLLLIFAFFSFDPEIFSRTGIGYLQFSVPGSPVKTDDTVTCAGSSGDTLQKIVRFDHSENGSGYYYVKLSLFRSEFERLCFYEKAREFEIYISDKNDFHNDSAVFITTFDKEKAWLAFRELYQRTKDANVSTSEPDKKAIVNKSPFYHQVNSHQSGMTDTPLSGTTDCTSAQVACSANVYSFPSGTYGTAPPPVNGYPNYGCLGTYPGPAWFYMQVGVAGDIIIFISQVGLPPSFTPLDVDFICWGPFSSLTDGCATGLTGTCPKAGNPCCNNTQPGCVYPKGNMVDCSYSPNATETCHILNAQVGDIYILLLTNFSQQPGTITFQQTAGTGVTNCNIVLHCSVIAITTNPTPCDELTNTFSVSGNIEFSNPSPTGTLTITDNTAVPPVFQTFNPPFTSPLPYSLTNIPCDGLTHFLTAVFSDSLTCNLTQQYVAPAAICPQAQINGGGSICNDGIQQATITVTFLVGGPPFTFVYAIDGISQAPVVYNNTVPYQINTFVPGVYSLVSISNQGCSSGTVSGSATVTVNPLPTAAITGDTAVCEGAAQPDITFTGGAATPPYTFTYNINGGSDQTVTTVAGNSVAVPAPTTATGIFSYNLVKVQDGSTTTCSQLIDGSATVTVNPLPTATISGTTAVCRNAASPQVTFTGGSSTAPYTFTYNINGGSNQTVTTTMGNSVMVAVPTNATGTFTYTLVSVQDGSPTTCSQLQTGSAIVTVYELPVPVISGPVVLCSNTSGTYSTEANMTGYSWTVTPGGIITGGGSTNTVNILWTAPGTNTITVNYTNANGCIASVASSYTVTVNPLPVPTLSGPNPVCTGMPAVYSTQAGLQQYSWTISPGGTKTGGGSASDPTVTVTWTTPGPNTVSVNYEMGTGCTAGSPTIYNVTVNPSPVPVITSPVNPICITSSTTYTTQPGMTGYTWSVSPAGTVLSGSSSNVLTVRWDIAGAQFVTVNYTNGFTCTALAATKYDLQVNPLPVTTITQGPGPVCQSVPHAYQAPADPACTFTWSVIPPGNGTIASGQGSNAVSIDWQTPGNAVVVVTGTNTTTNCLSSSTLAVAVKPKPNPVFTACFDLVTTPNAKKIILRGGAPSLPVQGVYSGNRVSLNVVSGNYEFDPFGAGPGTYPITYTYTNTFGCPASPAPVSIAVQNNSFFCGGNLTDVRDGKIYKTAMLAGRCWMIQNLAYGTALAGSPAPPQSDNCQPEKYCAPADATCSAYGGLYQWDELMDYTAAPGAKGLCPPEWHLPSEAEWQQLIDNLLAGVTAPDANGLVASDLKDPFQLNGFHALLGGLDYLDHTWAYNTGSNTATMYWTSAINGTDRAVARGLNVYTQSISNYVSSRANAFSARCVKD